jgi:predicted phosphodiesterase
VRVAALYDVHGNLPALEAALAEVERSGVELVVVGGDVASGPFPTETIEALRALELPTRFVRGNADRELVELFDGREPSEGDWGAADAWCAAALARDHRDFLAGFEPQVVVDVDGLGAVRFCHGSPRSDTELLTPATPEARLSAALAGVSEKTVVCGHTHVAFDRTVDGTRLLNAGSVGMPYGGTGAHWALLGPGVELRRTAYDLERAAARISTSGWPLAASFAAENVLETPSAEEAIASFEELAARES